MDWLKCFKCGKNIDENEIHYTINLHKEVFESGGVSVIEADTIKVYCLQCAELFDFNSISVPLKKDITN